MLEGGRISEAELVCMLMYAVLGTAYFFMPDVTSEFAGHDAWLTTFIATLSGFLVAGISGYLAVRFPGFNFFNWTEIILGRVGGKIIQFFYVLWLIHVTAFAITQFVQFMHIAFMPMTPSPVFSTLLLFLTATAVYSGVEVIGRMALIFLPVSLVIAMGMIVLAAGLYNFANIMPFLDRGITAVLAGSISPFGWQSEIFLGAMFFPFLKRPDQGGWIQFRASIWTGLILLLISLSVALAFGDETGRLSLSVFSVAREINLIRFFQHLETFVLILWISNIFMKVAVWQYATVIGLAQWLNLQSYRPLVLPVSLLLATLSSYDMTNVADLIHFLATVLPFYATVFTIVLPGILLLLSLPQKKKLQRKGLPATKKNALPGPQPS